MSPFACCGRGSNPLLDNLSKLLSNRFPPNQNKHAGKPGLAATWSTAEPCNPPLTTNETNKSTSHSPPDTSNKKYSRVSTYKWPIGKTRIMIGHANIDSDEYHRYEIARKKHAAADERYGINP